VEATMRSSLVLTVLLALGASARADIKQPNGTTIPNPVLSCYSGKPGGLAAVFACVCDKAGVCNIGAPCPGGSGSCDPGTNATCETTIWHNENDNTCIPSNLSGLDPIKDAAVTPETFRPVCGLNFTMVSRGGAMFKNAFGWYNVDPGGAKPDLKDLHVLIDCNTANGTSIPFNLLNQPDYKGGDIAFFVLTPESHTQKGSCANGDCCASLSRVQNGEGYAYYSQPKFNPDNAGASSYIHLLIYNSKITPYKYYFTWEDTFNGSSNDFSDFITSVSGISCPGGGLQCETGKPGICGLGLSKCVSDGSVVCEQSNQPAKEVCDGLDNDCNSQIDDGATCPNGLKCYQGVCVGSCQTSQEFACQVGYECDKDLGMCIDTACKGKLCQAGEICRNGTCGNGCDGVTCPLGQLCQVGVCVDFCAGRTCNQGEICKLGVCLPNCLGCGGLTCTGELACHPTSGDCYDPSCKPECGPGTYCKKGKCVGPCDGVVCPGGVTCVNGVCPPPGVGKPGPKPTGDGGVTPTSDGAVALTEAGTPKPPAGFSDSNSGCNCRVSGVAPLDALAALLVGLVVVFARRLSRRSPR